MLKSLPPAVLAGLLLSFDVIPLLAAPSTDTKAPVYSLVKTVKGDSSSLSMIPTSISDTGEMCGEMVGPQSTGYAASVSAVSTVPVALTMTQSNAYQVNKDGICVGCANSQAAAWRSGKLKYFDIPPGYPVSVAQSINEYGRIVGVAVDSKHNGAPFVRATDGTVRLLRLAPGYDSGEAVSINRAGDIVGTCEKKVGDQLFQRVCVWPNDVDTPRTLKTPNGESCRGCKINNVGDVLGEWTTSPTDRHGCLWRSGKFVDLGSFPNCHQGNAADMNDAGDVVGWFDGSIPFLWHSGHLYKLQDLIVPKLSWGISAARAINNRGEIVAEGGEEGKGKVLLYTVVLRPAPSH